MKTAALVILGIVPSVAGLVYADRLRKNQKYISSLLKLLKHIKFQIEIYVRAQKEIFELFEDKYLEEMGFLPKLRERMAKDSSSGFNLTVNEFFDKFRLDKSEEKALKDFAADFGRFSKEMQINECEKVILEFENAESRISKDIDSKIKLSTTIGFSVGLGLVILLI